MQKFGRWWKELDELLRGSKTDPKLLAEGTSHLELKPYVILSLLLGVVYGVFMGLYAMLNRPPPACWQQMLATAIKVPALFFLTLIVTFPSLYVFSALLGARLMPLATLRVVVSATAVNLAVLASFGPITGFFTITTTSYGFMKLLNVLFFAVAGLVGLGFLARLLRRLEEAQSPTDAGDSTAPPIANPPPYPPDQPPVNAPAYPPNQPSPTPPAYPPNQPWQNPPPYPPMPAAPVPQRTKSSGAQGVFKVWLVLYALVGAQMGWVLRPFIGAPDLGFTVFRAREANIFLDILRTIGGLFAG